MFDRFIVDIDDPEFQKTLFDQIHDPRLKITCWMKSKLDATPILLPFHTIQSPTVILDQLPLYYQKKIKELAKAKSQNTKQEALVALYLFYFALPTIQNVERKMKPMIYLRTKPRPSEQYSTIRTGYLSVLNESESTPTHFELVVRHELSSTTNSSVVFPEETTTCFHSNENKKKHE